MTATGAVQNAGMKTSFVVPAARVAAGAPRVLLAAAAALTVAACATPVAPDAPPPERIDAAYVVIGAGGQATARALVTADTCPALQVDGRSLPMQVRAGPATAPRRAGQGKASVFPGRVCEAPLPAGAACARIGDRALPLVPQQARRIVVLGDSGCRIKDADNAYQDCADTGAWPFHAVADAAAREHPDLVVHVGDYHYRENACPPGRPCGGSPWGYGADAWAADFFVPAGNLLAAAPWVMARGNHEMCSRAGQGWFRYLDAAPYEAARNCDRPDADAQADFTPPYVVPLGDHWQLIVFDSARASRPLDRNKPADAAAFARYQQDMDAVATLAAAPGMHSIFVSHHPVLGFAPDHAGHIRLGTPALLGPMRSRNGTHYFPDGIELALHGHVHTFQAIGFRSAHPVTLVAGHGGDLLEPELPDILAPTYDSAPGVQVDLVAHGGRFGYLVLQRAGAGWTIDARGTDGVSVAHCTAVQEHLDCPGGRLSRPAAGAAPAP